MTCVHPVDKLNIWRVWTTHFNQNNVDFSEVKIVLECKCGHRESLISRIGDNKPI